MEKSFKAKYDYCHVFSDRIVITKTPEIEDLVADYTKTLKDFLKTLMVFFIFITIFTALSVILYYNGSFYNGFYGLSIYTGAFALFFLVYALYSMLFISGSPVIYRDKIVSVKFKKSLIMNGFEIGYKEFGLTKKRGLAIANDQQDIDNALKIFLDEKLIEDKDIAMNGRKIEIYSQVTTFILFAFAIILVLLQIVRIPFTQTQMMSYLFPAIFFCGIIIPFITKKIFTVLLGK
jgi:hypothetical protein